MSHQETWRSLPGAEGYYEVSDLGQVRSVPHMTSRGMRGGCVLKQFPDTDGYLRVNISVAGQVRLRLVHQLVLETFVGPANGRQGRHGRGGKLDNSIANLSYGTPQDNSDDKYRDGTMACGERQGHARFTAADIRDMRQRRAEGEVLKAIALRYATAPTVVSRIVRRESWAHLD